MEMLLYQSTQFRDVKKILDRAHGFAGLLTAGGIEASRLDVPFVCDQKVHSRYDDACAGVRRILTMQLGLTLPKGFSIPLEAEDLAVFFSQQCGLQQMQDYLVQKRERTQADIRTWLRDRPWDTHPVTATQAAARRRGLLVIPIIYTARTDENVDAYRRMYEKSMLFADSVGMLGEFERLLMSCCAERRFGVEMLDKPGWGVLQCFLVKRE